jgi:hypothetical protein
MVAYNYSKNARQSDHLSKKDCKNSSFPWVIKWFLHFF